MLKSLAALLALTLSAVASAQSTTTTTTVSPGSQQVQLLAPQLVAFSGSIGNFDSLVTGLTQGTPVTLTTIGADGVIQIVTFVPGSPLPAADVARSLETARQNLIARGIAVPTAQQLAVALMGGTLATPVGNTSLAGVLTGTALPRSFQVRNELLSTAALTNGLNASTANLQGLRNALAQGTLTPARGPMSIFDVNQALQLAANVLAQQGIVNPTPEQLRIALLGGNVTTTTGSTIALQGVLQGTLRNTSDSPLVNTSTSPLFGTSDTGSTGTTAVTPTITPPAASRATPPLNVVPRGSAAPIGATTTTNAAGRR
jgi:hypothetical protein